MLELKAGLKYPWGAPRRLWNILWVLLPIIGWFALGGYGKRIINSIVKGNTKELPDFGDFWDNFIKGVMIFLKFLPLMIILMAISYIPYIGQIIYLAVSILLLPWIWVNLMEKYTLASTFEFDKAIKIVFGNFIEYIVALLKTLLYVIIYAILSIVLVGIPCIAFGQRLFIADFYAKNKK